MKCSFRITKYHSYDVRGNLYSGECEWTSFYDVGGKVSLNEYFLVESEYVDFIIKMCNILGVDYLEVDSLENHLTDCVFKKGQLIPSCDLKEIIQLNLREEVWCKLKSNKMMVHFGYDFYMYIICDLTLEDILDKVKTPLNIECFQSPYL